MLRRQTYFMAQYIYMCPNIAFNKSSACARAHEYKAHIATLHAPAKINYILWRNICAPTIAFNKSRPARQPLHAMLAKLPPAAFFWTPQGGLAVRPKVSARPFGRSSVQRARSLAYCIVSYGMRTLDVWYAWCMYFGALYSYSECLLCKMNA